MIRIAICNITKKTSKFFDHKNILNSNIAIYGSHSKFNGHFPNINKIFLLNYTDGFMKNNLDRFIAPNMYFTKPFDDSKIYISLQKYLNDNMKINVYVNDTQYEKFMTKMENSVKYESGEAFDNSMQINPYNFKDKNFIIEELYIGNINKN